MSSTGEDDRDDSFSKEIVTNNLEIVVDGLVNAASYSVSVIAFVADYEVTRDKHGMTSVVNHIQLNNSYFDVTVTVESLPVNLLVVTSPLTPTMQDTTEVIDS